MPNVDQYQSMPIKILELSEIPLNSVPKSYSLWNAVTCKPSLYNLLCSISRIVLNMDKHVEFATYWQTL